MAGYVKAGLTWRQGGVARAPAVSRRCRSEHLPPGKRVAIMPATDEKKPERFWFGLNPPKEEGGGDMLR
ncbi:protein of unknown function [Paraburkholderia kururiensis]